jgi:cytochrome P450
MDAMLLSSGFFSNPYPTYARLRTEAPVYWCQPWNSWIVTRYADVVALHREDGFRFSSANRSKASLDLIPNAPQADLELLYHMTGLFEADPPEYTRLRSIVTKAFKARLGDIRQRVSTIVDKLLGAFRDASRMDVIRDLAYPLPAIVVAEMLGVPPEDRSQFKQWSTGLIDLLASGKADLESARQAERSLVEARAWLRKLVVERRARPQNDMLSDLVVAAEDGDMLSEADLLSTCFGFLTAGHETTTNLIGNGLFALLEHPDQLRQLANEPELITTAVEELLRYDCPLQRSVRIAKDDINFEGARIAKGQFVYTVLASANRDPDQFPNPDRLDIRRDPNRHLAFGFGIHHCVGAPLARIEGAITLSAILRWLPGLRLADDPLEWQANIAFHGLKALPVVFH